MNVTELIPIGENGWIWLSNIILLLTTILNVIVINNILSKKTDLETEIDDLVWKDRRDYLLKLKLKVIENRFVTSLLHEESSFSNKIELINNRVNGRISTDRLKTILDDLGRLQEITSESYIGSEKANSIIDSLYILNVIDGSVRNDFRKITVPFEVKKSLSGYKSIKSLVFYAVIILAVEAVAFLGIGAIPFAYAAIFSGLTGLLISNVSELKAMGEEKTKNVVGWISLTYVALFYFVIPILISIYSGNIEWVYTICLMLAGLMGTIPGINLIKILVSLGTMLGAIAIWSYGGYIISILYFITSINLLKGRTIYS